MFFPFFYKAIVPSQEFAADSVDHFIQCLKHLITCNEQGYSPIRNAKIANYPINLRHESENIDGWLFHSKGLEADRIAERVINFLLEMKDNIKKVYKLNLFPVNCKTLTKEKIVKASIIQTNGDPLIKESNDEITDPSPGIELEVCQL